MMDPNEYETLLTTLVASFDNVNSSIVLVSILVLFLLAAIFWKDLKLLNVLSLGREQAINLGVDYDRSIRRLLLGVTCCISMATALVGPLAFLGLITANLSRQLFKTYRHGYLVMGSILFGMIVLAGGQMLTERVFSYNVPISVFVTMGGGLYFLYLLLRSQEKQPA